MEALKFVMAGHVDHGKSTLIGRLLADTDSLQDGKLDQVKELCDEQGREFEYAFVLDALQEEQEQGITIDITTIEFETDKRHYTIIDAPGHKEFLKNMISGAAKAEAAILIIDADEGVREQTKKHAYLLSLIGISQVYVVINKMDLVGYKEDRFNEVKKEAENYMQRLGIFPVGFIPASAKLGDNVTEKSEEMNWYKGPTVVEAIDEFEKEEGLEDKPLRFPVQDVYKFDDRRIIAGRIESGRLEKGEEIKIHPSGKAAKVKTIEAWPEGNQPDEVSAGQSVGITIDDEFFIKRGEVITHSDDKPQTSNFFACNVFWMGKDDLKLGKKYKLKLDTEEVECEVYTINKVIDSETLEEVTDKDVLHKHDVGNIVIKTKDPLVFDSFADIPTTGRFVIVDNKIVSGGGIIEETASELQSRETIEPESEHVAPKTSLVSSDDRKQRYGHSGRVVWITGLPGSGKEDIAKNLERELFREGKNVYYLDSGNVRLSLSSDLGFSDDDRKEHIRRLSELANTLMDAGFVVIVVSVSPHKETREYARNVIGADNYTEVFVDAPLKICKQNDPHGIYTKAERGEKKGVPGIDVPYEESEYGVLRVPITEREFNISDKVKLVVDELEKYV